MSSLLERLSGAKPQHSAVQENLPITNPVSRSAAQPDEPIVAPSSYVPPNATHPNGKPTCVAFVARNGTPTDVKDGIYHDQGRVVFVLDGREITLPQFDEHDFFKVEEYLRKNRKSAVASLTDVIDEIKNAAPEIREALLDRAYADIRKTAKIDDLSRKDVADWLETRAGVIYSMWVQLSKKYPDVTEEDCNAIMVRLSMERAMEARDQSLTKALVNIAKAPRR